MKNPKTADVFCNSDLAITKPRSTFPGNLYVNGDIFINSESTESFSLEVHGDLIVDGNLYFSNFTSASTKLEIHGNLIVDRDITVDELVVHGSLMCNTLDCEQCTVSENIFTTKALLVHYSDHWDTYPKNSVTSEHGQIIVGANLEAFRVIAQEGSINANSINAKEIIAFDSVTTNFAISNFCTLIAGETVKAGGTITAAGNRTKIDIFKGGLESRGFKLD